jgi:branched-chain amino acid transport system substrate-binding protein
VTTRLTIVSEPGFESPYPLAIAVGAGFVWVLNGNTATVTKIDPAQRTVVATIPIGIEHLPVRIAAGRGAAWVANVDGTLSRIDAESNAVTTIAVGHRLKDVAFAAGAVWTTTGSGLSSGPVATPGAGGEAGKIKALPTTFCSPLYYAAGARPTVMFASDLPLQGPFRTPAAQVSQAIQFVLKRHGFRAGRYSVAYQSCDDSTAPEGYATPEKCAANATAFSHNRDVIALVAPFNSGCTQAELPIANAAQGGPLPMISFSNTVVGFTHPSAGTPSGTTGSFYPTGTRNYVRIVPADDYQGAANAVLARRLGAKRIYIAREPFDYGIAISAAFRNAARRLGLRVAATTEWDPEARDYGRLARAIKRSRADSVFVAGSMFAGGDKVVRSIRSSLGPGVRIITPDGFTPVSQAVQFIGADAEGITVSVPGAPNERLPRRGKEFIRAFRKAVGETPYPYSVYAAQATEVLLQAIAASDGTRASVRKNLFKTRVSNGILGNFSIDSHGDTTTNAITIYRIRAGKPVLFDVVTPSASLVRR